MRPGNMRDNNALPIQFRPPNPGKIAKPSRPYQTRRAIRLLEGGFTQTGRVIMSARQTQPAKTRDNNTLPNQNHPPITVPPSQSRQNRGKPTVPTQPAGRFRTRRVVPSPEGNSAPGGSFCHRRVIMASQSI